MDCSIAGEETGERRRTTAGSTVEGTGQFSISQKTVTGAPFGLDSVGAESYLGGNNWRRNVPPGGSNASGLRDCGSAGLETARGGAYAGGGVGNGEPPRGAEEDEALEGCVAGENTAA